MVGLQPERKGTTKKARGKTLAGKKGNNPRCNPWHSEPYKPMAGCLPEEERHPGPWACTIGVE